MRRKFYLLLYFIALRTLLLSHIKKWYTGTVEFHINILKLDILLLQTGTVDIPGLTGMGTDYYPYVFYKIGLDLVEVTTRHWEHYTPLHI